MKTLGNCQVVDVCDERMILFAVQYWQNKWLFVNIYMPYCTGDSFHDFVFYLGKISSVVHVSDTNTPYIFILKVYNGNVNNGHASLGKRTV